MANEDLKRAIHERIRKLQLLEELADDPEAIELFQRYVTKNGNGHHPTGEAQRAPVSGSVRRGRTRGPVSLRVEEILRAANGQELTTEGIAQMMTAQGFQFEREDHRVAVNEALRWMEENQLARIARKVGVENFWVLKE